jgi:hypothetical protein
MLLGNLAECGNARLNMPANTDPQQHEAASPQMLVVRLPLRYTAAGIASR